MLQQLLRNSKETRDYQLRSILAFADEAKKKGAFALANRATGFLLSLALDDTRPAGQRELWIEVSTTDEYGDRDDESKYVLVFIKYRGCTGMIPMTCLSEDAQGRCYRRVGGKFKLRPAPEETTRSFQEQLEDRSLEAKFKRLMRDADVQRARALLK